MCDCKRQLLHNSPVRSMARRAAFLCAAAAVQCALGEPVKIIGVQGMDDQTMTDWVPVNEGVDQLDLRYQNAATVLKPGLRRYNAFWSNFEQTPPSPAGSPPSCPAGKLLVPTSESDRIARGYRMYHCYDNGTITAFDGYTTRDAQIGAASAFIVYGSPAWAADPACTGFPWGPDMYRAGCLPWTSLDAWEDYILFLTERYSAPWGSGRARVSGLVIWNEVQSQGWADPSPVLPNRYSGPQTWSPAQLDLYVSMIANLTLRAGRAAARNIPTGMMLWMSTDHFTAAPPLKKGDVYHLGLYDMLPGFWAKMAAGLPREEEGEAGQPNDTSQARMYDWAVAVHPYDAGDPRQNLTAHGVYTFATLKESVSSVQCSYLVQYLGVNPSDCWTGAYPQTAMWASEQGWPYNNVTMNKTLQARNICYAHGLSLYNGLWSVSHNFFQGPVPTSQGDSGDFSLIDELPVVWGNLSNGKGHATFDAYAATAPGVYGVDGSNYCCTAWGWGCPGGDPWPPKQEEEGEAEIRQGVQVQAWEPSSQPHMRHPAYARA